MNGHAKAALYAGNMRFSGLGTVENKEEAGRFYRQAAEAGNTDAMNSLAIMLESLGTTTGEPTYLYEAAKWFLMAARLGMPVAAINLTYLLASGNIREIETTNGEILTLAQVKFWLEEQLSMPSDLQPQFEKALLLLDRRMNENFFNLPKSKIPPTGKPSANGRRIVDDYGTERDEPSGAFDMGHRNMLNASQDSLVNQRSLDLSNRRLSDSILLSGSSSPVRRSSYSPGRRSADLMSKSANDLLRAINSSPSMDYQTYRRERGLASERGPGSATTDSKSRLADALVAASTRSRVQDNPSASVDLPVAGPGKYSGLTSSSREMLSNPNFSRAGDSKSANSLQGDALLGLDSSNRSLTPNTSKQSLHGPNISAVSSSRYSIGGPRIGGSKDDDDE
jgi:hypothetical protein